MAIASRFEDYITMQLVGSGFTILDLTIAKQLFPSWGGAKLPNGFDKASAIKALGHTGIGFYRAWIGERAEPALVAAHSGRDLPKRIEWLIGKPAKVEAVDTAEVLQSIAPKPEPVLPPPVIDRRPDWVKRAEAMAARDKAESEVRYAQNELDRIEGELRQMTATQAEQRRSEFEARKEEAYRRIDEGQGRLGEIQVYLSSLKN